jgi:hypothetical protein
MKIQLSQDELERRERCVWGLQCPECDGVQISSRLDITGAAVRGLWLCEGCGCQFDRNCYGDRSR